MSVLNVDFSIDKEQGRAMMAMMNVSDMIICMLTLSCTVTGAQAGGSGTQQLDTRQAAHDVQRAQARFQSGLASFAGVFETEKNLLLNKRDQAACLKDKIDVQRELIECLKKTRDMMREQYQAGSDADEALRAEIEYLDAKRCLSYMENSVELDKVLVTRFQLKQAQYNAGLAAIDDVLAAREELILHRRDLAVNANERLRLQRDLTALLLKEYELQQQRQDSSVAEGGSRLLHECEQRHRDAVEELKHMETAAG